MLLHVCIFHHQTPRPADLTGQWLLMESQVMVNWRGGWQIKEWGGVSLRVAQKQPPVILLARQKHCRTLSNTTGDLHIFRDTHSHTHSLLLSSIQSRRGTHTHARNRLSRPDRPPWVCFLQGYKEISHYFTSVRLLKFKESCYCYLDTEKTNSLLHTPVNGCVSLLLCMLCTRMLVCVCVGVL